MTETIDLTSDCEVTARPRSRKRPRPVPEDPDLIIVSESLATKASKSRKTRSEQSPNADSSKNKLPQNTAPLEIISHKKGVQPLQDYPHPRYVCSKYPFTVSTAPTHCDKCYCFVCDVLAPKCLAWSEHCQADDSQLWRKLRRERQRTMKRYNQGVDKLAMNARVQEQRARREKEIADLLEALGEPRSFAELQVEQIQAVAQFCCVRGSSHVPPQPPLTLFNSSMQPSPQPTLTPLPPQHLQPIFPTPTTSQLAPLAPPSEPSDDDLFFSDGSGDFYSSDEDEVSYNQEGEPLYKEEDFTFDDSEESTPKEQSEGRKEKKAQKVKSSKITSKKSAPKKKVGKQGSASKSESSKKPRRSSRVSKSRTEKKSSTKQKQKKVKSTNR